MREVRVELETPEAVKIVNGKSKDKLGHLEGRSNKLGQIFMLASPTDNRSRLEWTIQAPSNTTIELHVISERAGSLHKKIVLK
jgi:hypothetical protein